MVAHFQAPQSDYYYTANSLLILSAEDVFNV